MNERISADRLNTEDVTQRLIEHRRQFSSLEGKRYFNYGGQGPMADSAIAAYAQGQQTIQTKGPFSAEVYDWLIEEGKQKEIFSNE